MHKRLVISLLTAGFIVVLSVPASVFSQEDGNRRGVDDIRTVQNAPGEKAEALRQKLQELKDRRQADRQQRLDEARLRVCEQRTARIAAIMDRAVLRAERQLELFTTIAERVKNFYAEKGLSLNNYGDLVAAVDAAKASAQANLEVLEGLEPFDCESEDPKGQAEAFKLALQSVNQDLKDYRTAIKDLIVGVKSAAQAPGEEGDEG